MTAVEDVISDLDAALERITAAAIRDDAERRRALREVLACIYELRAYREGPRRTLERVAYHQRARATTDGLITEGIVWLRGNIVHLLVYDVVPKVRPLNPDPLTFPGEHTYPGSNLMWRRSAEVAVPSGGANDDDRRELYDGHVAGRIVLECLHSAYGFLVADPGPTA